VVVTPVTPPPTPPAPVTPPAVVPVTPTSLPFTGVNTKPLLIMGLTLILLGLCLLGSSKSWRRARRRLAAMAQCRWSLLPSLMLL
jgi:hypothetical protein